MEREVGNPRFPIWLLGDSNPKNWADKLTAPLDPRHPARHNIWTSVLDVIQDSVFRKARLRVDTSELFIRNAIEEPDQKPKSVKGEWSVENKKEVDDYGNLINEYKPRIIISFGSFSWEFLKRSAIKAALDGDLENSNGSSNNSQSKDLAQIFWKSIEEFDPGKVNLLPLLHVSIARIHFLEAHANYCHDNKEGNYFEEVGEAIAIKLLQYKNDLNIWIER